MKLTIAVVTVLTLAAAAVTVVQLRATPGSRIGPVQTELDPLIARCHGLAGARSARWRFWRLEPPAWAPEVGTDQYALEVLVTVPAGKSAALRKASGWTPGAPVSVDEQLVAHVPDGVWLMSEFELCAGYQGRVFTKDGTTVFYALLNTM